MPELPEVETTRLSFAQHIAGACIEKVRVGKPLRWPLQCEPKELIGRKILAVRRRGKYLLLDMDQGLLLIHLGMSGSVRFGQALSHAGAHDHFDLITNHGTLRLNDPRRFGAVVYAPSEHSGMAHKLLCKLGVEPLSDAFDARHFHAALKRYTTSIKQVLLAGHVVVGVGNIYAAEALFDSGIRPTVRACKLSYPRVVRLHAAIRAVLAQAVAKGGSTLRNFSSAQGEPGHFQLETKVYGRAGEACRVCGSTIRCIQQGQRSSFFCPACQKF